MPYSTAVTPTGIPSRKIGRQPTASTEVAAQDRPGHRGDQHRQPEHPHHRAALAGRGRLEDDRHAERHHHRAADPLEHAEDDQDVDRRGHARVSGEEPSLPGDAAARVTSASTYSSG